MFVDFWVCHGMLIVNRSRGSGGVMVGDEVLFCIIDVYGCGASGDLGRWSEW
jgi:hypothetical protein